MLIGKLHYVDALFRLVPFWILPNLLACTLLSCSLVKTVWHCTRGCWQVLSPTRKETSYSDKTRDSTHSLTKLSTLLTSLLWLLQATQKKKLEGCPSNQVSAAAMTASDEKWLPFIGFFRSREQAVVRRGQIRRIGWVIQALEAQGHFHLVCKCSVSQGIVVRTSIISP